MNTSLKNCLQTLGSTWFDWHLVVDEVVMGQIVFQGPEEKNLVCVLLPVTLIIILKEFQGLVDISLQASVMNLLRPCVIVTLDHRLLRSLVDH